MAGRLYEATNDLHLKPMHLAAIHSRCSSLNSLPSHYHNDTYHALPPTEVESEIRGLQTLDHRDTTLKKRIRVLRVVSRLLATIVSAITLVPLILTLVKFFQTRHVYFDVNGHRRTAWANDTIPWYTYMYTAVAAVSFLLDLIIMVSYCKGIRTANRAANVSTWWTWAVILSHVVTWAVAAGIYRKGKEPDANGKHRDLWGWTCSDAAKELQHVLTSVNFGKYCNVQSSSFYSGIANVVLGLLTVIISIMAIVRTKTKKKRTARAKTLKAGTDFEALRG